MMLLLMRADFIVVDNATTAPRLIAAATAADVDDKDSAFRSVAGFSLSASASSSSL